MALYLDANAHLPMNDAAIAAFTAFNRSSAGHGHAMSPSAPGREAALAIEQAREQIAELIGAERSGQIYFTNTCSQACEWAILTLQAISEREVYMSPAEHAAIREAAQNVFGEELIELKINLDGMVIHDTYYPAIINIFVQNEIGTIQNIKNINSGMIVSDMSQAPGKINFKINSWADMATFGAHKFGGPGGVGFLYLKDSDWWTEIDSGSRYLLDRAGTPDAAGIVATAAALKYAVESLPERTENMLAFKKVLEPGLKSLGCEVIGENAPRVPNTTFIKLPPNKGEFALLDLSAYDIHVGLGSACGSMFAGGASPLLRKMGIEGASTDFMRISNFGEYSALEAEMFLDIFKKVLMEKNNVYVNGEK